MQLTYVIRYCGGKGPETWDGEVEVKATSLREALDREEPRIQETGAAIVSIEQID